MKTKLIEFALVAIASILINLAVTHPAQARGSHGSHHSSGSHHGTHSSHRY